jgi:uncharacterized protein (DUF362 family)
MVMVKDEWQIENSGIYLRYQQDYNAKEIAWNSADIIESIGLDIRGKTVLVKPSFVYPSRHPVVRGIITQPQFVAGVARALRDKGARRILVAESSVAGPSRVSFHSTGILPLIRGLAEPVFLDESETVEVDVKDAFVQDKFRVPKIWLDADLYVSLPKIKTNMFAELTLSVKNNLGLLRQHDRLLYHDFRIHKKLADLFKVRPPDLVIADCIIAGEGQGPLTADPVELGLMIGGANAVAVDVVACHLAGYKPEEVEHLKLLIQAGYGPGRIEDIDIDQPELLSRRRPFRRPDVSIQNLHPDIRVFQGSEYFCPWGCAGLVRGAIDGYIQKRGLDTLRPMNIILGKPIDIDDVPDDLDPRITIVLGDCAEPYKDRGIFVPGCCPRPLDLGIPLARIQGMVNVEVAVSDVLKGYAGHYLWRMRRRVSGKPVPPVENHVPLSRALREGMSMIALKMKSRHPG